MKMFFRIESFSYLSQDDNLDMIFIEINHSADNSMSQPNMFFFIIKQQHVCSGRFWKKLQPANIADTLRPHVLVTTN